VKHFASSDFWDSYRKLPEAIQKIADKNFEIFKDNPQHSSIRLKNIGVFWSARVGLHYRAIAKDRTEGLVWIWIGHHSEYDQLLKNQ
jgi:hypothetical protein